MRLHALPPQFASRPMAFTRPVRCGGSAMLETVLVLPVVFTVLGLVFFFGGAFEGRMLQQSLTRHQAAHQAHQAIPLAPAQPMGLATAPQATQALFLRGRSAVDDWEQQPMASPAMTAMAQRVSATATRPGTGELALAILRLAPRGGRTTTQVTHHHAQRLHEATQGHVSVHAHHDGPAWAWADAQLEVAQGQWTYRVGRDPLRVDRALRDIFYLDFDRQMDHQPQPQARMVALIRGLLYAHQPGYVGPTVRFASP